MRNTGQLIGVVVFTLVLACGSNTQQKEDNNANEVPPQMDKVAVEASFDLSDKGVGPITSLTFDDTIDEAMVKKGEELYNQMCSACHKPTTNFIGPAPKGVFERRSPEWVMNMILNPEEMLEENTIANALLEEYNNVPMTDLGITEEQARAILEYFRTL